MQRAILLILLLGGCGSDDPCDGVDGTCIAISGGASAQEVQTALLQVPPGGTVAFASGTYSFETDLSLDIDGVTVRGAGKNDTTLSFANQATGAQGMLVTANDVTVEGLAIEDAAGDALKFLGADGVTIRDVRVEWTGGPLTTNGAYGLYPVQCKNVLIEKSLVMGASDAGIYVGQSENIIVRNNEVRFNVAGIEIENSFRADVHDNIATENTGGILVFNLPDLEVDNGAQTRVYNNQIFKNNTLNFAPEGNIVASVPTGTGMVLLAAHQVEIFGNSFRDHLSVNLTMTSYVPIGAITDTAYNEYPTAIYVHDNEFIGVSDNPTGPLGFLLAAGVSELNGDPEAPLVVPDITWEGALVNIQDPPLPVRPARSTLPADQICIRANGDADFANLAWPLNEGQAPSASLTPHDCALEPLPAASL